MWIAQVRRKQHVQTLQVRLELLKLDWCPCSLSAEVAVLVEHSVELGVELVDELVIDILVGCCSLVRQVATVWYPLTVVQS